MARFRTETVVDPETGKIFLELYYPDDAAEPIARTKAIYDTHEQAQKHAVELMKRSFPNQPVRNRPSN